MALPFKAFQKQACKNGGVRGNSLRMEKKQNIPRLFIVIQQGGTSAEHYAHQFSSEQKALRFARSAEKAAYNCLGPFEISLEAVLRPAGKSAS